jgi:hypothetical protein
VVDDEYVIEEIFRMQMEFYFAVFYLIERIKRYFYMMKTNNNDELKMMKNIIFDQQILKTKQKNRLIYKYKVVGIDPSRRFY